MPEKPVEVLSIILPAYNEEKTIAAVLDMILNTNPAVYEIIVVNDGSQDRTSEIVSAYAKIHPVVHLINHIKNMGKTEALKTGFATSTGEIVIIQDADLEYDPVDIPSVIGPILADKADVVYGSRFLVRKATRILYFRHYIANRFITFLSNLFTNINFSDVETCYKAFRGEIIRNMIITSKGFGFEIEVTAKIAKLKCRVFEVPISYYGRTYEEGKKIGVKDGVLALYYILKYNVFIDQKNSFLHIPSLNK